MLLDPAKPTGVRPDAVTDEHVVLIKACSTLHLTHQIRLATFMARSLGLRLLLVAPEACTFSEQLDSFIAGSGLVDVRRA